MSFEAILPIIAFLSFLITEWIPWVEGKVKPLFLAALAAILATIATRYFEVSYEQAASLIFAALSGNYVHSVVKAVPGLDALKKPPRIEDDNNDRQSG